VTLATRAIFALLVAATFGAFFAAQRLKHTPPVIQQVKGNTLFSPNGDGWQDELRISFLIKRPDDVTVQMVNAQGDPVRTLISNRPTIAYRKLPIIRWDGRTDAGTRAPDGVYRIRVSLRREGRSRFAPKSIRLDTTPPTPVVTSVGPNKEPGPELLPNADGRARISFPPAGRFAKLQIFKTAPGKPRLVTEYGLKQGATRSGWSGRTRGRPVSPGTYVAVVRWRDKAGNLGTSIPLDKRGLPRLAYGDRLPGHGGITIRYLELQPPRYPVTAGQVTHVGVDARGDCYRWTLRKIGTTEIRDQDRSCKGVLAIRAPRGVSGVYLLEARTKTHVAQVPIAVQSTDTSPILVVLPLMTWQGRNPVDDDGDGRANLVDDGLSARTDRVFSQGKLPQGFADAEGPLLAFLARHGRRFDVTTDYALATGKGPKLGTHRGVVLPGDVRWLPSRLSLLLRRWVRAGGGVFETGLDSLRRDVTISKGERLVKATAPAATDLFGTKLRPLVHAPTTVTNLVDRIQLFSGGVNGGTGVFAGFDGYEETAGLGPSAQLVASAVIDDANKNAVVISGARIGTGLVIRTGLEHFADRLTADENSAQLVQRAWALLDAKR